MNSSWAKDFEEMTRRHLEEQILNQPVAGQIWVMRQSEEATLLRQVLAKKYELPEKVRIIQHEIDWGGTRTIVMDESKPDSVPLDMGGLFEAMYKLYCPTTWERLDESSASVPLDLPARVEG